MTLQELQHIVLRLANQCHVRYWINRYGKVGEQPTMALDIHLPEEARENQLHIELAGKGFRNCGGGLFAIERTNEDGSPYISRI